MNQYRKIFIFLAFIGVVWIAATLLHAPATAQSTTDTLAHSPAPATTTPSTNGSALAPEGLVLQKPRDEAGDDQSGDEQIGVIGKMLGRRLFVMAADRQGRPAKGVTINAKITLQPENSKTPASIGASAITGDDGNARFNLLLADAEGQHSVYFYIVDHDGSLSGITYTAMAMGENWGNWMLFNLLGGMAIFLYGMKVTSDCLQSVGARRMRNVMSKMTKNPVTGVGMGAAATFAMQSSTAMTTMLVSFVSSGMMAFRQTLPMILGAAIGTTLTVQLISFNVQKFALPMVFAGFSIMFFSKEKNFKKLGESLLGFGLIFYGMKVMTDASAPLRHLTAFRDAIQILGDHPIWGTLCTAVFTAILHSSGATLGVAISISNQGAMSLEQAMPIIYGANIGTCVTALVASVGQNDDAKRVAWAHLIYKTLGVLIFFPLTFVVVLAGQTITTWLGEAGNASRAIANTHTMFNLVLALMFLPLLSVLEKITTLIIKPNTSGEDYTVKYIDQAMLESAPELMIGAALREISRMGGFVEGMLKSIGEAIFEKKEAPIDFVHRRDDKVDRLMGTLLKFLNDIDKRLLDKNESAKIVNLMFVVNDLENIGDIIDKNLAPIARKMINRDLEFSGEGRRELEVFFDRVLQDLSTVIIALTTSDTELATQVMRHWEDMNDDKNKLIFNHLGRLREGTPETVETSSIHLDLINYIMRIEYYVYQMARVAYGELRFTSHEDLPASAAPPPDKKSLESE